MAKQNFDIIETNLRLDQVTSKEDRVICCVATNEHFVFAFFASRQKIPPH